MENIALENITELGVDYNTYKETLISQVDNPDLNDENEIRYFEYRKLNLQRSQRLEKYFVPSEELIRAIDDIEKPQVWMVITESWCGDSAQNIPVFVKAASLNSNITLRIIYRDQNPEIMDLYLTNGSRSIPKLVVFDENNHELFQWGPRPREAQELFNRLKNEGVLKSEINKELQLWYGKNRGKAVEKELVDLLNSVLKTYN